MSELAFSIEPYQVPGEHPPPMELARCLRCGRFCRATAVQSARWVTDHAAGHLLATPGSSWRRVNSWDEQPEPVAL